MSGNDGRSTGVNDGRSTGETSGRSTGVLSELAIGQSAKIKAIAGDDEIAIRLLEMGLTPGVSVLILGTAPMGDPLELEVRGYRLSVRRVEAARIEVLVD